jgi:serine/threonine-protein kinase
MTRPPGSAIGRYQILGYLARGETTVVYEALEPELGRKVALKILPPSAARDPEEVTRFLRLADLLATLDHANVLPVVDYGREADVPFVATPIAGGGTLAQNMAGYRNVKSALLLAASLANALDYLHGNGVVHGRIGPGHILFDNQKNPLLTGFGRPYTTGARGAVPSYVTPEQDQGLAPDGRSDIFQLGAMLYELLLGDLPAPDPDFTDESEPAALPDDVQAILAKALAAEPDERFQTAAEMAGLLTISAQRLLAPALQPETPPAVQSAAPPAAAPESAAPEHVHHAGPLGHDKDPRWLAAALVGLAVILTLCCLLAIFAAFSINDRVRDSRPTPQISPVATARLDTNVRAGPNREYAFVGLLREGEQATIHGISPDGQWWQIGFDKGQDGRGWVPAAYVIVGQMGNVDVVQPPPLTPVPAA